MAEVERGEPCSLTGGFEGGCDEATLPDGDGKDVDDDEVDEEVDDDVDEDGDDEDDDDDVSGSADLSLLLMTGAGRITTSLVRGFLGALALLGAVDLGTSDLYTLVLVVVRGTAPRPTLAPLFCTAAAAPLALLLDERLLTPLTPEGDILPVVAGEPLVVGESLADVVFWTSCSFLPPMLMLEVPGRFSHAPAGFEDSLLTSRSASPDNEGKS